MLIVLADESTDREKSVIKLIEWAIGLEQDVFLRQSGFVDFHEFRMMTGEDDVVVG